MKHQRRYKTKIEAIPSPRDLAKERYGNIYRIDGSHSLKLSVPDMIVEYPVYRRTDGKIFYFNFALAKEMGIIPHDHANEINAILEEAILDQFSLQIINEYDILNHTPIPNHLIKSNRYMATRYLQLQHPSKRGFTSGDGRSIWNGEFSSGGKTWDISSCGTGATQLSPATAKEGRFFRTGDPRVSYGNGRADLDDGIGGALFSEILSADGISTERTLAIIRYPNKQAIIVRAAPSLLRPAHFFSFLKRGKLESLTNLVNYYYDRQIRNSKWPDYKEQKKKLDYFVDQISKSFAETAARFESDYIFCWLEWDGDNILTDAGIIDYGSIRRFGACHHAYRYDDSDRFSTSLLEQKFKARYIVQTFAQIRDYIITGTKKDIESFRSDAAVKKFNDYFRKHKVNLFLHRLGLSNKQKEIAINRHLDLVKGLLENVTQLEHQLTLREQHNVADGINREPVFSLFKIFRNLPQDLMAKNLQILQPTEFLKRNATKYLSKRDLKYQSKLQHQRVLSLQKDYLALIQNLAKQSSATVPRMLLEMSMRASLRNRLDRVTGNGIIEISCFLASKNRTLSADDVHTALTIITQDQAQNLKETKLASPKKLTAILKKCFKFIVDSQEQI